MDQPDSAGLYQSAEAGFAELAATYDARLAGNPLYLLESTQTLAALPDVSGRNVVDFGCGTGRYALQLARLGAEAVTGIDLSPAMLTVARTKARRAELPITWQIGDLRQRLPVADNTFDVAVCAVVLSFLPEPTAALAEMARTLKPGGTLVLSDTHPHGLLEIEAEAIAAGRSQTAPYLRFTAVDGEEWRIPQYCHSIAALFQSARATGLILEHIAEPACDRRLANTYASLRNRIGIPLALVMRLRKQ